MSPAAKAVLFATIAVLINWHYSVASTTLMENSKSSTTLNISGAGLVSLFCFIALIVLGRRLYRRIRTYLDSGTRIPLEANLVDGNPCLILFLLFIHISSSETFSKAATTTTTSWGYGSDQAPAAFLLGAGFILIFQMNANLVRLAERKTL